ncbi:type II secretion system secretin GspD [Myxococcota bacterium]|nr:type II secretion system secretin GspD [Myxococcota bacterium]
MTRFAKMISTTLLVPRTPRLARLAALGLFVASLVALPRLGLSQEADGEAPEKEPDVAVPDKQAPSDRPIQSEKPIGPARLPLKKGNAFPDRKAIGIPGGKVPGVDGQKLQISQAQAGAKKAEEREEAPTVLAAPQGGETAGGGAGDLKTIKSSTCKPLRPNAKVTFDFKGDINELITTIAKTTCKNFIVTQKIRSQKFEIISPTPITVDEAWAAFLSALEANEFTIFQVGRYYKIIQATDGTRAPVPIYKDSQQIPINDRMVTKIWRMKHATDINAVVNYLNIFKSGKGQIHPFSPTNTIIATDFGTSMERIERIFEEIDQPGALEQVHVVPVEFAGAQEIADKLSQVFEPAKAGAGKAPGGAAPGRPKMRPAGEGVPADVANPAEGGEGEEEGGVTVSKILADERTNKLIIIASDRAFKQIMALKKELDVPDTGSESQIQVIHLKHADAEELASTLASLAQGKPTTPRAARGSKSAAPGQPQPAAPQQPAGGANAALFQGEVKVTADKPTNSLIVTASKSDFNSMKRVIEMLDVARYQVFVEAVILEVSVKRDRQLGLTWHGGVSPMIDGKNSPILFGNQPTSSFSSLAISTNPLLLASVLGFAGAARGPTLAGSEELIQGGIPSVGVVIQALQSTNDVNVVSTPHLLTLDNEEAEIQVSEKRPFPSGLTLGGLSGLGGGLGGLAGGAGGLGNLGGLGLGSLSFNREDVGLTLKMKPQISDEDYVRLELDQELSDVAGTDAVTGQTITSKRAAKTVVVVRSQDSVVIGGLVRDRETVNESKVPLFGDIPLIGWLFKRQVKDVEKVNLLLVLTPYIIRGPEDFRQIFERKMNERKEFVDRFHGVAKDYEPEIDWARKRGPLASYRLAMRKELTKAENEGPGTSDEKVIRPGEEAPSEGIIIDPPRGGGNVEHLPPGDAPPEQTPQIEPEE